MFGSRLAAPGGTPSKLELSPHTASALAHSDEGGSVTAAPNFIEFLIGLPSTTATGRWRERGRRVLAIARTGPDLSQ
jgi:hypothetical protein